MKKVAIVGVGLIGGSFALALRKTGFSGEIAGVSSDSTLSVARSLGVVDHGSPSLEAVHDADLVFLSQPISGIIRTLGELPRYLKPGALVTDAGSTKGAICAAAAAIPRFVGGHPMAGKEVSGVENSDADLFRGRRWLLTSHEADLEDLIRTIGAQPVVVSPEEHDWIAARVSHVPQLVSNALRSTTADVSGFGGPGLESMTRLSRSPYSVWQDILESNRVEIAKALDEFVFRISSIRQGLEENSDRVAESFERK